MECFGALLEDSDEAQRSLEENRLQLVRQTLEDENSRRRLEHTNRAKNVKRREKNGRVFRERLDLENFKITMEILQGHTSQ